MHVKKNDNVIVLTGKDRGFTGEVIAVDRDRRRVKVARRNMITKHRRPNPITGEEGARVEVENWIDASNVALYSDELEGPVRTKKMWRGSGGELFATANEARASFGDEEPEGMKKVRVSKKTDEVFE